MKLNLPVWLITPALIVPLVPIRADVGELRFRVEDQLLPEPLSDHTATKVESKEAIYVVGGCNSSQGNVWNSDSNQFECGSLSGSIYEFDANTLEHKLVGQLSSPRSRHTTVNINDGYLWIIGGRDASFDLVGTVEAYEISTGDLFTFVLPEEYRTSDHASFHNNKKGGYAYVAGGYSQEYTIKSNVFRIDSATSIQNAKNGINELVIEDMENMLEPRADFQGTLITEDLAIVVGGFGNAGFCEPLASTEQYNIKKDLWTELPPLRQGTSDKTICNFLGWIISFGGEIYDPENVDCKPGGKTRLSTDAEYLTRDSSEWVKELDLPQPRFRFTSIPFEEENRVVTFGGQLAYSADCDCYPTTNTIITHYDAQYHSPHPHGHGDDEKNSNENNGKGKQCKRIKKKNPCMKAGCDYDGEKCFYSTDSTSKSSSVIAKAHATDRHSSGSTVKAFTYFRVLLSALIVFYTTKG